MTGVKFGYIRVLKGRELGIGRYFLISDEFLTSSWRYKTVTFECDTNSYEFYRKVFRINEKE
jgi:hypothetical protein